MLLRKLKNFAFGLKSVRSNKCFAVFKNKSSACLVAAATAEVLRILAVNVENPLGFSGIDSAKWEMAANPGRFASRFGGEIGVF